MVCLVADVADVAADPAARLVRVVAERPAHVRDVMVVVPAEAEDVTQTAAHAAGRAARRLDRKRGPGRAGRPRGPGRTGRAGRPSGAGRTGARRAPVRSVCVRLGRARTR